MASRQFILNLGKLLIAAAWVDGKLEIEEINALKELLFNLPDISGEEWMELELYLASPVKEHERQALVEQVFDSIASSKDKQLVLTALEKIMSTQKEASQSASWLDTIRQDIEGKRTGLLSHLTAPLKQALHRRTLHYAGSPNREARLEDFIKNAIYFQLVTELGHPDRFLDIPETEIKKICLAAGLMAKVAWADNEFCVQEQQTMLTAIQEDWGIPEPEARLIMNISHSRVMHGLDSIRLTTGFRECTSVMERQAFLRCLFTIANATGNTSHAEIEEIRGIAKGLELPHEEFIKAKLTIPREKRKGL